MALPTLSKTWQFNVNNTNTPTDRETDHREALWSIKTALVGFSTNPWTVDYSCDSITAGTPGDAVDRWAAKSNLVWATSGGAVRSWIVFNRPASGDQVLFSLDSTSASNTGQKMEIEWSPSGVFTSGSTTAKPTATDGVVLCNAATSGWLANLNAAANYPVHIMHADDGTTTYIIMCYNNLATNVLIFADLENAVTPWTYPMIAHSKDAPSSSTEDPLYTEWWANNRIHAVNSSLVQFDGRFTTEAFDGSALGETLSVQNEITGSGHIMSAVGFGSIVAGSRGRHGSVPDLYAGALATNTGDSYPGDSSHQFVQFGDFIWPWDGTLPVIS